MTARSCASKFDSGSSSRKTAGSRTIGTASPSGSRSGNVENDYLGHPAFAGLEQVPVVEWHRTIWQRLRVEQPELTHLIDNSKRPEWARRFPAESIWRLRRRGR